MFGLPAYEISIHAPREGSDNNQEQYGDDIAISIHAPREGSDGGFIIVISQIPNFNPRSP